MSSRFHNKYHRHNHHTSTEGDPRYPDASHDPIASPDFPFLGPFHLLGTLSAASLKPFNEQNVAGPAGIFSGDPVGLIAIAPPVSGTALQTIGNAEINGNMTVNGLASLQDIEITGEVITTYQQPVTALGEFLQIRIGNSFKAIRLWQIP